MSHDYVLTKSSLEKLYITKATYPTLKLSIKKLLRMHIKDLKTKA